jgi:hypothetical protein
MTMTQHYLAGELSLLLARLHAAATNQASVRDIAHLRHEVETGPLAVLTSVMARALELANDLCWDSLERGDVAAFTCRTAICADLWEFGVCASLLEERHFS